MSRRNVSPIHAVPPLIGMPRIYRQVTFDLETFDHLKAWHRELQQFYGVPLTNSELLRTLILAHRLP